MRTFFRSIIFYSVASVISLIFFSLLIQFKAEKLGPQSLWKFPLNIGLTEMRHVDIHVAGYLYYKVRILCWIMTNTKNYDKRAVHIRNTWGKRCNKLLLIGSTKHDDLSNIDLQVGEGRDQLWHKTREAFTYIYKHHINEADWFLKADDDTYVIMENLRYLLYPYHPQIPIYFGCKFKIPFTFFPPYMSGGGGYVLSKEALKRLVEDGLPTFEAKSSTEDLEMGNCLHMANVTAGDSRDDDGQSRFFPDTPKGVLQPNAKEFWTWTYKYYKAEQDCCSEYTISFHYVDPKMMYFLELLLYKVQVYGIVSEHPKLRKRLKVNISAHADDIMSSTLRTKKHRYLNNF